MMGLSVIILGGLCASLLLAVVVAVLVIWMQNRQESVANPDHDRLASSLPLPGVGSPNSSPTPDISPKPGAPAAEARIREWIAAGNKLEAIKIYREITGSDLLTAKNAVEAMQRGEPLDRAAIRQPPENAAAVDAQIRALLAAGKKINAIQVHRAAYGNSLHESKAAVEAIERELKSSGGGQF